MYPRKTVLNNATYPAATKLVDLNEPVCVAITDLQATGKYTAQTTKS